MHPEKRPYYNLLVFVDNDDNELKQMYSDKFKTQQEKVTRFVQGENICVDAGVDLFNPSSEDLAYRSKATKIRTNVKCAMYYIDPNGDRFPTG